jgi:hypothetical protein
MQNATVIEVHKILSSTDVSKSTGHDGIFNKLLKDSADIISYSLSLIFNTSINTVIFPNDFKTAIISPIQKAGCKTENLSPNNWKLETNGILVQQQAGFRKRHCTQTSLLNI